MKFDFRKAWVAIPAILIVAGVFWFLKYHHPAKPPANTAPQETAATSLSASQMHDTCEAKVQPSEIFDCYTQAFHDIIYNQDPKQALMVLDQVNQLGGYGQQNCHPLAHKIGNISLHKYGTVLAASPYYLPTCYSGYYHGLLEEYISTEPNLQTAVVTACGTLDNKVYFDWFQCTHGLGHGIMQYETDDVLKSVKDCDFLSPANLARDICYGGVFMENITTDAKTGHPSKFIKASDPIYPCDIVDTQYKSACYFLSSSMILRLNGYNFQAGIKTCDTAEQSYRYLCYQSMGRDISGTYHNNIDKVNQLCQLGTPPYIGDCYFGAVRDFINLKGEFDTALPMCAATPAAYKPNCYNALDFDLGLFKKGADYEAVCDQMPDPYKQQCLDLKKS